MWWVLCLAQAFPPRLMPRDIGSGSSTAFLLLGDTSAPPPTWRIRRFRIDHGFSRKTVAGVTGTRNPKVRVVVGLVVACMENLGGERDAQEERLRAALHRLRVPVAAALSRSGQLGKERPPVLVEVQWCPELLARGRVARALEEGLQSSIEEGAGTEDEAEGVGAAGSASAVVSVVSKSRKVGRSAGRAGERPRARRQGEEACAELLCFRLSAG
jgi:hypothetical protein